MNKKHGSIKFHVLPVILSLLLTMCQISVLPQSVEAETQNDPVSESSSSETENQECDENPAGGGNRGF